MGESDALTTLLAEKTTARNKLPGVVFCIGLFLLLAGGALLISSQDPPRFTPSALPPFPSGDQLQSILSAKSAVSASQSIAINSATVEELDSLPGIGLSRAQKLIQSRPYRDYQDLIRRSGISETILAPSKEKLRF